MPETAAPAGACNAHTVEPERVAVARSDRPPGDEIAARAALFALLGDPNRLRIVAALVGAGELCVCDLAAAVGMGESAVSHALGLLRARGVVAVRRSGRRAYYSLRDPGVRTLLAAAAGRDGERRG